MKAIKLSEYFQLMKPTYVFLKITPDRSIRNYNSSNIAKAISLTYKGISKRIKTEGKHLRGLIPKKIIVEQFEKFTYVIDIKKTDISFYFIVPSYFENLAREKISSIWPKASIEKVEGIKKHKDNALMYQLNYKLQDALSLSINTKDNYPLNDILNVAEIMEQEDRVTIYTNIVALNQFFWKQKYKKVMDMVRKKEILEKNIFSNDYIFKTILNSIISIVDTIAETISEVLGGKKDKKDISYLETALGLISKIQDLSSSTKSKERSMILKTQIVVASESNDDVRKYNNAEAIAQSYNSIKEDNELVYSKVKSKNAAKFNILDHEFKGVSSNYMSSGECHNFIQVPGRYLIEKHKNIKAINVLEQKVHEELLKGYIRLGICETKSNKVMAYMSADKNLANLGLVTLGPQGAGKSEFIINYIYDAAKHNESVIVIDFIKDCALTSRIKSVVDKSKVIEIDLTKQGQMQSFCFNEINNFTSKDDFEKLEKSNMLAQLTMSFIDSINSEGNALSGRMRKYLSSAANIVFLHQSSSLRDVINCLENHQLRHKAIKSIPDNLKEYLQDEIHYLKELDEHDKKGEFITGTKDSKIEFIMDRVNLLKEDIKLKYMFNKSPEDNVDFVKAMDTGKVILIKIPDDRYNTKFHKNILTTFFTNKIWLSAQLRGGVSDKPLRTHVVVDEIFQAPTSERILVDILPQARKFQVKFVFSAHYLSQIETIREALKASGASYMLLQGTDKKNYDEMKADLLPYEYEDLKNLKQWNSLNMIKTKTGYSNFITALPPELK